jgi:ethanolamine utilization microcompartment shell protein EutS
MSIKSIPDLKTQINTLLFDNSSGAISASDVRTNMIDAADSLAPVDHTHTNAEVNTSIAASPATSATAMGLGTGNTPTFAGLKTTGNVGIGTTSPSAKLEVKADSATLGGEIKITNDQSTVSIGQSAAISFGREFDDRTVRLSSVSTGAYGTYPDFVVTANKNASGASHTELLRVKNNGNVGIGTAAPSELLDVSSNTGASVGTANPTTIRISDTGNGSAWDTVNSFANLDFYSADTSGSGAGVKARVGAIAEFSTGAQVGLAFATTYSTSGLSEKMRIDASGKVGIGTTSPDEKLDVVGNIKASGTVQTGSLTVEVATELSSATAVAAGEGAMTYISNESGGATIAFSDGTVWRRVSDRAPIS